MRVVLQRVRNARVEVDGKVVGSIGQGLCLLVGIHTKDQKEDMDFMQVKTSHILPIFMAGLL